MKPEPQSYEADQIRVGLEASFEREIREADILAFADLSGDWNPLHTDAEYARGSNYEGRVVHGAFQLGLASAMAGMHLPGLHVVLGGMQARFPSPLYFPCTVRVGGRVTSWDLAERRGQVRVTVSDCATETPTADITYTFAFHEGKRGAAPQGETARAPATTGARQVLLLTGAGGGLGHALCRALAGSYDVVATYFRKPLSDELLALPGVHALQADLADGGWTERLQQGLGARPLYGIVHAAWPGVPKGGLLDLEEDAVEKQLRFGALETIRLAQTLRRLGAERGGRLLCLGSIYGHRKPQHTLAAYSLGKAVMEDTVRMLAPELARKGITVNAVCPAVVPVGMNKQMTDLHRKKEAAQIPLGRTCEPLDVVRAVEFLLSPAADFISGEVLRLTGGQL